MATRSSALELARSNGLLSGKHMSGDSWIINLPFVSDLPREASEKLFCFRERHLSIKGIDFFDMKNNLPLLATSACNSIRAVHSQLFSSRRGITLLLKSLSHLSFIKWFVSCLNCLLSFWNFGLVRFVASMLVMLPYLSFIAHFSSPHFHRL